VLVQLLHSSPHLPAVRQWSHPVNLITRHFDSRRRQLRHHCPEATDLLYKPAPLIANDPRIITHNSTFCFTEPILEADTAAAPSVSLRIRSLRTCTLQLVQSKAPNCLVEVGGCSLTYSPIFVMDYRNGSGF